MAPDPASTPLVRPATVDDAEAMVSILEAVAGEGRWVGRELPLPADMVDQVRAGIEGQGVHYVVVEVDGQVVGDAGLRPDGPGILGLFMVVLDGHRGRGIGQALMEDLVPWARAEPGVHKVVLQVWPHNERAIALYRRFGFIVEGYRHRHWPRANGDLWDVIEMGLLVEG